MRLLYAVLLLAAIVNQACAQEPAVVGGFGRGYIGITIGPSFPLGKFAKQSVPLDSGITGMEASSVGVQLNLITAGYLFSKHIGIAGTWFGSAYARTSNYRHDIEPWSCGAIMLGPLISFPVSEKIDWDLRPMIGSAVCSGQRHITAGGEPIERSRELIFNIGTNLRFHLSNRIALLLTADYFATKLTYDNSYYPTPPQSITALSLGAGVAYRLK